MGDKKTDLKKLFTTCKGMDRNLYLTVTRVKVDDSSAIKSELSEQARVMQAVNGVNEGLSIVFTNYPGGEGSNGI